MKNKTTTKKRIIRAVIIIIIGFILIKYSTYGLWPSKSINITSKNEDLAKRLKNHVKKLSNDIGDRNIFLYDKYEEAVKYLTLQFKSFGYDVQFQTFTASERKTKNIMVNKIGSEKPEEIFVVGAHFDTCFNPGADDNASGIAGLLELARLIKKEDIKSTIRFVAFSNEEPPFFHTGNMGSKVYAKELKTKKENVKAALIIESIGYYSEGKNSQKYPPFFGLFYPNKGNFIAVIGNFSSGWLVKKVKTSFKNNSNFPIESVSTFDFIPGIDFSDNWSFWKEGFSAVMITDTANFRNPNYHTNKDTFNTLDYYNIAEIVSGFYTVLCEITKK
ncbi:MAG: M20/M25/M40 family metallo-hydrolase [Candidatus Firestonebacteria bacterium]